MKKICAIITGGEFSPLREIEKADFVIACDGGCKYAKECGIVPDALVGDFDSYKPEPSSAKTIITLPKEKDDTDTMFAVRYAASSNPDEIYMYCVEGGRVDHFLGNIQAAAFAAQNSIPVRLFGNDADYYIFSDGEITLPKTENRVLSVLSLTDKCEGVFISGVKYPLNNAVITNAFPIGISNEWTNSLARISLKNGTMLVICAKLQPENE